MKRLILLTCLLAFVSVAEAWAKRPGRSFRRSFVQVSARDPRYFCLSDGQPYIPVGCNIAAMGSVADMEHYLGKMHRNGANFGRVWLNTNLFEIETRYGEVDTAKLVRIDRLLELADRYGIKIKFCRERYGDHPAVFGWELWNEMNAVETPEEHLRAWNVRMLPRVKEIFPKNLVMQSLGSLDRESSFPIYEFINRLPPNEVAQVHRYIDEGAELAVCGAPVDSMASDAIAVLRGYGLRKPMLLAESGAVKPVHTGPHPIYKVDTMGSVLHDVLFAPFFSGAAGPGHLWHWDHHIDKQHTWFQMGRFARAVEGVDPLREGFEPVRRDTAGLRVYVLRGEHTLLAWCRDTVSTWRHELSERIPAQRLSGLQVDFTAMLGGRRVKKVRIYDPWRDEWVRASRRADVSLPDFTRSVVVRIEY